MRISEKARTKIQKYSRTLFLLLAWLLLLGIVTQVVLACLAVFVDGGIWQEHRNIMNIIEFIPAIMFIFGIIGGIPKLYNALSLLLFLLIQSQYYTNYGWLGALHAASAIVLFMISLYVAWGSYQIVVKNKKENNDNKQQSKWVLMEESKKTKTKIQKHSETVFIILAWLLLLGLFIQVSLAGLAIFADGKLWKLHTDLVYIMEFIPAIMFIFGIIGEIPKLHRALSFVLFFIFNFQYYTTYVWLGAIHAVFGILIFMITMYIAWGSYQTVAKSKKENNDNMLKYTGTEYEVS
jgi:hypothetical protein